MLAWLMAGIQKSILTLSTGGLSAFKEMYDNFWEDPDVQYKLLSDKLNACGIKMDCKEWMANAHKLAAIAHAKNSAWDLDVLAQSVGDWLCCLDIPACQRGKDAAVIIDELIEELLSLIGAGLILKATNQLLDLLQALIKKLPDIPLRLKCKNLLTCLLHMLGLTQCFPAGTPVLTPFGHRPIDEIQPGDQVCSRDIQTGEWVDAVVGNTFSREHSGTIVTLVISGEEITATDKHPFWVQGGRDLNDRAIPAQAELGESTVVPGRWVAAEDLEPGDLLATPSGPLSIESVVHTQTRITVYNLHIPETQTYTVGTCGLWVHNDSRLLRGLCGKPAFIDNAKTPGQAFKNLIDEIGTNLKGTSQVEKLEAFREGVDAIQQHVGNFTIKDEFLASNIGGGAHDFVVFVGGKGPKATPVIAFKKNGKVYTGSLEASVGNTPAGEPVFNVFKANLVAE